MGIYEELQARGLIAQVTNEPEIREMVNTGKATFYIGFDPTADSLHVGHFMALCLMKRLQMAGNKPIALIGGGTGHDRRPLRPHRYAEDADPGGPSSTTAECFKRQMERFIDFGEGKAIMVNNADWLLKLNYIELLREVGACFSVNNMLRAECYKQRMEKGLSFLEFNYMIMQSYDFYYLFQHYGCNMQFGGDDQWSNMLGGTELIRRKLGKDAHAMTITLLLNSEGKKMGKTASGAVWLDPNKTTPFDFYQYWRNVGDADVLKCIRMLTFLPLEQIDAMDTWEGSQLNQAKEILAHELTKLVHGEDEADKAQEAARALFGGSGSSENMPATQLPEARFTDGKIGAIELLVACGLCASNGEARRLIQQGGVAVNDQKVASIDVTFDQAQFAGDGVVIKKGKKVFHRAYTA
ncbi:MAG: tyrosine--tRNA ligase [Dysosmobacter sp.]